jgi:flagellar basal body-associated protein FliL
MPEEEPREEAAAQPRSGGRKVKPSMIAGVVVVAVLVAVALTVLLSPKQPPPLLKGGRGMVYDSEWLDIPTLEIKDIPLSVPLVESGAQRKSLTVGIVIRFAPPEGKEVDVKALQKTFIPRVSSLSSEFRHTVIEQMNSKSYSKLSNQEVKNQLLKTFRQAFQESLKKYGLDKEARVHEVMWKDFFWN